MKWFGLIVSLFAGFGLSVPAQEEVAEQNREAVELMLERLYGRLSLARMASIDAADVRADRETGNPRARRKQSAISSVYQLARNKQTLGDRAAALEAVRNLLERDDLTALERAQAWSVLRELGGQAAEKEKALILAVLTEVTVNGETMVIAAFADGEAAVLWLSGEAVTGASSPETQAASRSLVEAAGVLATQFLPGSSKGHPPDGTIRFTLLTPAGMRLREERLVAVESRGHPLNALYAAMHRLFGHVMQLPRGEHAALLDGVASGDLDKVRRLLASGTPLDTNRGVPLLAVAVDNQDSDMVALLLTRGANADAIVDMPEHNLYSTPLLSFILLKSSPELVSLCIDAGADVNRADARGVTPLMVTAMMGDSTSAGRLIQSGARIQSRDSNGYTALMFAANLGKLDVARRLLDAGASPTEADQEGSTPLMFAAQHGFEEVVRLLLQRGAMPNRRGAHGLTALGFAIQNGHERTAEILRATGAIQ